MLTAFFLKAWGPHQHSLCPHIHCQTIYLMIASSYMEQLLKVNATNIPFTPEGLLILSILEEPLSVFICGLDTCYIFTTLMRRYELFNPFICYK